MSTNTPTLTPETAKQFDRYSVANAVTVKQALPCGCEPYVDVFTYRRWQAQGMQVQRGEKAIRLPLIYQRTEKDPETGEETTARRMGRSAVFCRCQVKPKEAGSRSGGRRRRGVISIRTSGGSFTRNANGRCEDAPCCGCCTI
jgi:hypothetical protein